MSRACDPPAPGTRSGLRLVFGASGYVGTNLVPRLRAAGVAVRAAARHPGPLAAHAWSCVEIVGVDALAPSTLPAALAGVDVAYYLVHSMAAGRGFDRLDRAAADHFREAAQAAGVRRIVYLGGLVPPDPRSTHLRSRRETGDRLRAGAVPVTEVRAGMIVGPGSAAFEVMRDVVWHLPVVPVPTCVRSRSSPIALDDLLDYLVRIPDLEATAGGVYDVGGPEVLSYAEMVRRFAALAGRRARLVPVPGLSPSAASLALPLVTTVPASLARALMEGLAQDTIANDAPVRALVPLPLADFETSVRAALEAERRIGGDAGWVPGAWAWRGGRPEHAFYARSAGASAESTASAEALWAEIAAIGGENGYYWLDVLWRVRYAMDRLVGGPGRRRGRAHPTRLALGDPLDGWRVMAIDPPGRLTLLMEIRSPGTGTLEFRVADAGATRRVEIRARYHPAGVWGLLYWFALVPFHGVLFPGLARTIARRAETAEGSVRPEAPRDGAA